MMKQLESLRNMKREIKQGMIFGTIECTKNQAKKRQFFAFDQVMLKLAMENSLVDPRKISKKPGKHTVQNTI